MAPSDSAPRAGETAALPEPRRQRADATDWRPGWSPAWAPFLDIDGTLLDIAERPGDVFVPEGLVATLLELRETCGSLALVTGRSLDQVDALFGAGVFDVAANHGAVLRVDGVVADVAGDPLAASDLAARLAPVVADLPGTLLEDKGHSVALHYRQAPDAAGPLLAAARGAMALDSRSWRLVAGKAVFELAPRATTKGTAVETLMARRPYAGRRPFFAGDDVTDEDAFEAVERLGGVTLLVGPERASRARWRLPSPSAFRFWLDGGLTKS